MAFFNITKKFVALFVVISLFGCNNNNFNENNSNDRDYKISASSNNDDQKNDREHFIKLGIKLYENKNDAAALIQFKKAHNIKKDYFSHFCLGMAYNQLKHYEKAIDEYSNSIVLYKNYKYTYYHLGLIYYRYAKDGRSIYDKSSTKSENVNPSNNTIIFENNDIVLAKMYLLKYINLSTKEINTKRHKEDKMELLHSYQVLGYLYSIEENYELAIENYKNYLNLDNSNFLIYYNLGIAFYNIRDFKNAQNATLKALELNPQDKKSRNLLYEIEKFIN